MIRRKVRINLSFIICSVFITSVMARHAHHFRNLERDCSSCPPGEGVMHRCNRHHDTECRTCQPGYYSSHHSNRRPCYPCSRCGSGLYVAHECTLTRDTVCDSCHTYRGPHNEDFRKKCIVPLTGLPFEQIDGNDYENLSQHHSKKFVKDFQKSRSITSSIVVVGVVTSISIIAVIVTITWFIVKRNRRRKTMDSKYTYHAVSTQDVVML